MDIVRLMNEYINENGLIKNVIAKKCGFDKQKLYRLLGGNQKMTIDEYETICRHGLGVDPAYFFKQKLSKNENKFSA